MEWWKTLLRVAGYLIKFSHSAKRMVQSVELRVNTLRVHQDIGGRGHDSCSLEMKHYITEKIEGYIWE
jgi:hypothetical protein